jgi:hypothetical protein
MNMARKKVKWGPGNALYDWKMRKGKIRTRSAAVSRHRRKGGSMAKKKSSRRSGGFGGMGKAIFPVGGFIGGAILGLGAAALAKRFIGAPLGDVTGAVAGFAIGGLPGAAGGYIHDNIGNVGGAKSGGIAY